MDPKVLKLKRGQIKGSITKLEEWVSAKVQTASISELEVRLNQLKKYEARFDEVQNQLEDVDVTQLEPEVSERFDFEDRVSTLESLILDRKSVLNTSQVLNDTAHGPITVDLVSSNISQADIPKFSGDYLQYPQWEESFDEILHDPKGPPMTDTRRFNLLKGALRGKAYDTIAQIPLIAGNYVVARKALLKRFYKPRLVFTSYIRKMWEAPKATSSTSLRQLCDTYTAIRKGLELIATSDQIASGVFIQLILSKCDQRTIEDWERTSATKDDLPTDDEFNEFLSARCVTQEGVEYFLGNTRPHNTPQSVQQSKSKQRQAHAVASSSKRLQCPVCDGNHELVTCNQFLQEDSHARYALIKKINHCVRCLQHIKSHRGCKQRCDTCSGLHHTLLHFEINENDSPHRSSSSPLVTPSTSNAGKVMVNNTSEVNVFSTPDSVTSATDPSCDTYTFLATALANFQTVDGNFIPLRILFDGGNQVNMISERARSLLGIPVSSTKYEVELTGINNSTVTLRKRLAVNMKAISNGFSDTLVLMVHPRLNISHPGQSFKISSWNIPNDINLADPNFHISNDVDIVLNSHHVDNYTLDGSMSLGDHLPRLRETKLGWVVLGNLSLKIPTSYSALTCTAVDNVSGPSHEPSLSTMLQNFWELEAIQPSQLLSEPDDIETHFKTTHQRLDDGRFMVRLPFERTPEILGNSRAIALKRLSTIERKCRIDTTFANQYREFIDEYIQLGHCSKIMNPESKAPHYYIPHFAVTNENSTTTRTRVVFDASCHTDNGISLNETLMVGPKIQDDLVIHLIRFRLNKYAITGDVSKMYRQILIHPDDRRFQYILWKQPTEKFPQVYELNTVTYGTACAPFLAIRCMQEIANTDGDDLPIAQKVVRQNFYVDDMLAGADTIDETLAIYEQTTALLKRGQMTIMKFQSNAPQIVAKIPECNRGTYLHIGDTEVIKTLGLNWIPESDEFLYFYELSDTVKLTRRGVLSEILRLFDPLGLVQPVIVRAKIFMQRLYNNTHNWDEPLSLEERQLWQQYRSELQSISEVSVPRCVMNLTSHSKDDLTFEVHGFCDASQKAYAACLYVRTIFPDDTSQMRLLIAKTRVAPLKTVSLPRLELCGALLLAELYERMAPVIDIEISQTYLWTDSTIVLRWVSESPHKWKPFIATRVTKIQMSTTGCTWRHIDGVVNPADIASRGCPPSELVGLSLWFEGPKFLNSGSCQWPSMPPLDDEVPDVQKVVASLVTTDVSDLITQCHIMSFLPLLKHVVWQKVRRIFSYVAKFINRLRQRMKNRDRTTKLNPEPVVLEIDDIKEGILLIVRIIQHAHFHEEMKLLQAQRPSKGMLKKLSAFYDPVSRVIRVGGRLQNAITLPWNERHPILLPQNHPVTKLIFMNLHINNLHAGPTALLAKVREEFWPLNGKVIANQTVHGCIRCTRAKPVVYQQIMGQLPEDRVTLNRPFQVCAVDFAGPFLIHYRLRGSRTTKVYLAIFVCFSTKAVHLELIEDLTVNAFFNGLQRFVNRRQAPDTIWSDNATNFMAANRKLVELRKFYFDEETQKALHDWCRDQKQIKWEFIPPRSPHFNGLVEAAVKSTKYHLHRLNHINSLTFPELNTVIIMIEGILNSRPLIPLSCSPDDGQPITPAHFLFGGPLITLPEPPTNPDDANASYNWKRPIAIKQEFWRRFSKEYLKTLQTKSKWATEQPNPKVDDLVLLVDKDVAPLKWRVGRICKLYPGKDEVVRVVDVKTSTGVYCRGITELCPVPRQKVQSPNKPVVQRGRDV